MRWMKPLRRIGMAGALVTLAVFLAGSVCLAAVGSFSNLPTVPILKGAPIAAHGTLAMKMAGKQAKLDTALAMVAERAKASPAEGLSAAAADAFKVAGGRMQVYVKAQGGDVEAARAAVAAAGGEVTKTAQGVLQAWVAPEALSSLAAAPAVAYVTRPSEAITLGDVRAAASTTEGLVPMNALPWHAAGQNGAGVKVAIIDAGFIGYAALLGTDLPPSITPKNFVDGETDAQIGTATQHGTACAEIVFDIAPQASLYLIKVNTNIDLSEAVTYAIAQGVNVISTSLGWYNLTPGDGTGFFANLVQTARTAGIIWLTAASNDREAHWGGPFSDADTDGWHEFVTGQEIDYFGPGDGSAYLIPAGWAIRVFLRWDDWTAVNQDYDLYLFQWNGASWVQVAVSGNWQGGGAGQTPTEYIGYTVPTTAPYGIGIYKYSATRAVNFEMFAPKVARLDKLLHARSLSNLADSPGAVTCAALDVNPPYPQESYSSEGPTNGPGGTAAGGAIKPDISGYANVSTQAFLPTLFNGTSAATPHCAGAAALVKGAYPSYTPAQIQDFLQNRAIDMGTAGKDTLFGYGRLYLGAPPGGAKAGSVVGPTAPLLLLQ